MYLEVTFFCSANWVEPLYNVMSHCIDVAGYFNLLRDVRVGHNEPYNIIILGCWMEGQSSPWYRSIDLVGGSYNYLE